MKLLKFFWQADLHTDALQFFPCAETRFNLNSSIGCDIENTRERRFATRNTPTDFHQDLMVIQWLRLKIGADQFLVSCTPKMFAQDQFQPRIENKSR